MNKQKETLILRVLCAALAAFATVSLWWYMNFLFLDVIPVCKTAVQALSRTEQERCHSLAYMCSMIPRMPIPAISGILGYYGKGLLGLHLVAILYVAYEMRQLSIRSRCVILVTVTGVCWFLIYALVQAFGGPLCFTGL